MSVDPEVVVFDVGAVLVDWDREHLYRELIPDPEARRVFLDDLAPNVAAARARGWQAHRFTGAVAARQLLAAVGLLPG